MGQKVETDCQQRINTGDGNNPKREFFGITKAEAERIAKKIKKTNTQRESQAGFTLAELRAALDAIGLTE